MQYSKTTDINEYLLLNNINVFIFRYNTHTLTIPYTKSMAENYVIYNAPEEVIMQSLKHLNADSKHSTKIWQ
jgi:hypothetical protein